MSTSPPASEPTTNSSVAAELAIVRSTITRLVYVLLAATIIGFTGFLKVDVQNYDGL